MACTKNLPFRIIKLTLRSNQAKHLKCFAFIQKQFLNYFLQNQLKTNIEVSSAGLNNDAINPVTPELIEWADIIFVMENIHPHDIGSILNMNGVAVRTGQHCAQPSMDALGISGTTRASFAFYNWNNIICIKSIF